MTSSDQPTQPQRSDGERDDAETVIDQEAADIDARSPDAPERIAELIEDADDLGLPTPEPSQVEAPDPDGS
jgi:hypothetical protein